MTICSSGRSAVIVAAPSAFYTGLIPYLREDADRPVPRSVRVLTTTMQTVALERIDERTVSVRPEGGYLLGLESLFRSRAHLLELNQRIELPDVKIQITELTQQGNPAEARFQFVAPLEDDSLTWFTWHDGQYKRFTLPPVGGTITLDLW